MLTFLADIHEYRWNDKVVPSVSEILAPLVDFGSVPETVLAHARDRGIRVHDACAKIDAGAEYEYDEETLPYIDAYRRFLEETGFVPTLVETPMYHERWGFAGTVDRVGAFPQSKRHRKQAISTQRECLLDLKTVDKILPVSRVQTAAYENLVMFNYGYKWVPRKVLHLRADGSYSLIDCEGGRDWQTFLCLLHIWNFKNEHRI